jgi:hypothetical protein
MLVDGLYSGISSARSGPSLPYHGLVADVPLADECR